MRSLLLAVVAAASATSSWAQASVTIFGVVDLGLTHGRATGAGSSSLNSMASGGNSSSKLGFRGSEDLGGGMTASFWLEGQNYLDTGTAGRAVPAQNQGITTAQGTGMSFTRRSTLSLSGSWGELRLGRDFTPSLYNLASLDPWANNGVATSIVVVGPSNGLNAGTAYSLVPAGQGTNGPVTRVSNEISYFLPRDIGGVYGQVSYWLGENQKNGAVNQDDGTGAGARLGYRSGPFDVAAAYSRTKYRGTPVATTAGAPSGDFQAWNIGGSWNFGMAKLMAHFARDERKSTSPARGQGWLLGVVVPIDQHEIRGSLGQYEIDAGLASKPRTRQVALGYVYSFSKRTALYADAVRFSNSDGARIVIAGATLGAGIRDSAATGLALGLRHNF